MTGSGGEREPIDGPSSAIDPFEFRGAMSTFATGVTAVCARVEDGEAVGMTVSSFTSVSLDPPLVSICVAHGSGTLRVLRATGSFAVSVLAAHQGPLCRHLASPAPDRFATIDWAPAPSGAPIIGEALAWFDCSVFADHEAGDHALVIGQVNAMGTASSRLDPLVFHLSELRALAAPTPTPDPPGETS